MTNGIIFTALADPTRRAIFESLRDRPRSVGEIARGRTVSRPAVSQHLKVLQNARLVYVIPEGTKRMYSIRQEGLQELRNYVERFWSENLDSYRDHVRRIMSGKKKTKE